MSRASIRQVDAPKLIKFAGVCFSGVAEMKTTRLEVAWADAVLCAGAIMAVGLFALLSVIYLWK